MPVLKLKKENPAGEVKFELNYLRSLTMEQRFSMMLKRSQEVKAMLRRHGYGSVCTVFKRV